MVRYVALAALAIWLGGTLLLLGQATYGGLFRQFHLMAASCGAIVFVCLFIMKFIGPPPRSFVLRAGLAFMMMIVAVYLSLFQPSSRPLMGVNLALGLILLAWYAHE